MNDIGSTGIQVAPAVPTEDEMSQVQSILTRAANAIVGMSQMKDQVEKLQAQLNDLQMQTNRYQSHIAELDELLAHVRQQRDSAQAEASEAKAKAGAAEREAAFAARDRDDYKAQLDKAQATLHEAEQSRDTAQLRVMELEDELKASQSKLDAIREGYAQIFGNEAKPAPAPAQPEDPALAPPANPPEAPPAPAQPEPARHYYGQEWAPGRSWDSDRQEYYDEIPF